MMAPGRRSNVRSMTLGQARLGDRSGAVGLDVDGQRPGDADRVGELDLAAPREAGGDDVLGDVARHVRAGTIDLGRILAAEAAAAVARHAAVGVDDDLASGQARVAHRSTDHEPAGRVDEVPRVGIEQLRRDRDLHHLLAHGRRQVGQVDLGIVLGADQHRVDPPRPAVGVVLDRDLALAVGTKEGKRAVLSRLRQPARDAVRQHDRHRHQLGRLVASRSRTSSPGRRRRAHRPRCPRAPRARDRPRARCRATAP